MADFKQSEVLDDENLWYCSKCKEHVPATKQLELFRLPRLLIISLKRFSTSKSRYGGFLGSMSGQKLDTEVDFPLQGLDMSPYVLNSAGESQSNMIYDCFAVSNHYGSVGFGHYTAFAKSPVTNKWYNYDDSHCEEVTNLKSIVNSAAYNLFYRLRDDSIDLNNISYE